MYEELVGLEGGKDVTFWKILGTSDPHSTKYWPAVVAGKVMSYFSFKTIEDWAAAKVERRRVTVSLTVAGNPVAAEGEIRRLTGKQCLAVSPSRVDIFVQEDGPDE